MKKKIRGVRVNPYSLELPDPKKNPSSVSEFIDPVFTKTSPKRSYSVIENERLFWACFRENWLYKFGRWTES